MQREIIDVSTILGFWPKPNADTDVSPRRDRYGGRSTRSRPRRAALRSARLLLLPLGSQVPLWLEGYTQVGLGQDSGHQRSWQPNGISEATRFGPKEDGPWRVYRK